MMDNLDLGLQSATTYVERTISVSDTDIRHGYNDYSSDITFTCLKSTTGKSQANILPEK